jgi:D-alanine-D-alanine ligase
VFVQVAAVSGALSALGHEPLAMSLSLNLTETIDTLAALKPAFVFNLVEAIEGKGILAHLSPLILENMKIPYTGAKAEATFLTSSKIVAKTILRANGIATPDWFSAAIARPLQKAESGYIIKSSGEHASLGLDDKSLFFTTEAELLPELIAGLQERLGGSCFAEVFIEGREIYVSLLAGDKGPEVLPTMEILFSEYPQDKIKVLCYRAKWEEDSFEYKHTPRTFEFPSYDKALIGEMQDIALRCWDIFNLRGYARVDFRVDKAGRPWVLEVNTNPCLSPDGGFVAAASKIGLDYPGLIERIVKDIFAEPLSLYTYNRNA